MLRKIYRVSRKLTQFRSQSTTTVDASEIDHFKNQSHDWWDENGSMRPLHSLNQLRIPFIRDGLVNTGAVDASKIGTPRPLEGLSILDVGCGGGILTECLSRIGGKLTGLDAGKELIELARKHTEAERLKIEYVSSRVEEHSVERPGYYDAVVASEVIEHVSSKEEFVKACVGCLKPGGSIFVTTISKTWVAHLVTIVVGEDLLEAVPKGTHQYEKFIEPSVLQKMLEDVNCKTELVHGWIYNPLTNKWHFSSNTSVCYGLQGFKMKELGT